MRRRKGFVSLLLMWLVVAMSAQDFKVIRFRSLPNDISAFRDPVYDLNGDACAVLKVVCDEDFVFNTPFGIVKRVNEVGEVWLYLPHGSIQLTIRHPKWGVLRDYRFHTPLEGRVTYELLIETPKSARLHVEKQTPSLTPYVALPDIPQETPRVVASVPQKMHYLVMANMGMGNETISYGIRLGLLKRLGGYVTVRSDFKSAPKTAGECSGDGMLASGGTPYYSGEIKRSETLVLAGGIHRLVGGLHLYEGIGYGNYTVAWGASNGNYYKYTDDSVSGIAAEAGLMLRINHFIVSAGASAISVKHWDGIIGVGIYF